jgi:hypothetical protein
LDTPHVDIPHGQLATHLHPSLNLNVGLSFDGVVSFDAPDWKASVAPLNLSLAAPKLSRGEGLHLLVGEDGEVGVSFDKNTSRHFFFLGISHSLPKFSLSIKVIFPLPNYLT